MSILPIEIKSGKDGYEFRAIPKLVNKDGNYKLNKGYIFTNQNICKKEDELYTFPIYMIICIIAMKFVRHMALLTFAKE